MTDVRLVAMGVYAAKAIEILGTTGQDELEQNEMMPFALIKLVEIVGEAANSVSRTDAKEIQSRDSMD